MKYKVGDKVRIKNKEWYEDNCNRYGILECGDYEFYEPMNEYCGEVVTITRIDDCYRVNIDKGAFCWTDEMIECKVENETKFGTASNPVEIKSNANCLTRERVDELATKIDKELPSGNQYVWELPYGYQFVDENGNVINATKIVLEKKKKEYPKTYEECCKVMNYCCNPVATKTIHKEELIRRFQFLLLYRDAYWKIAGEEMGLGKPWSPSDSDYITGRYCIFVNRGNIICDTPAQDCPLTFPTEEMRDAFYENFKELIEICKELL